MMPRKLTHNEFIIKVRDIHQNKFMFFNEYTGSQFKMKVHCNICGYNFESTPNSLLSGRGCKKCADRKSTKTKEQFELEVYKLYKNKFSILSSYNKMVDNITIKCNEHDEIITLRTRTFLKGKTCCSQCEMNDGRRKSYTTETYLDKLKKNEKFREYDFSKFVYKNSRTSCIVICNNGHEFITTPSSLSSGRGCGKCGLHTTTSKPVFDIIEVLESYNINHIREYKFDDCFNTYKLPFDFFLPDYNICIEYDGKQHFEILEHWGGEFEFNNRIENDSIKNQYCLTNNIKLYRIKYDENHIERIKQIIEDIL